MKNENYDVLYTENQSVPVKMWTRGVSIEEQALDQLSNVATLPFIHKHVAVMPDVHWGMGATIGSVVPTSGAIIPAAVGVDIGCGMMAVQTSLTAADLPDNLSNLRGEIEHKVPHGRTDNGGRNDRGAWSNRSAFADQQFQVLHPELANVVERAPKLRRASERAANHMGTLGTGNHFIEICLDLEGSVWAMLHSGSRGIGNAIGRHYIEKAKEDMRRYFINLPDANLAYLVEGTQHFYDYKRALHWAQNFALTNREVMMEATLGALEKHTKPFHYMSEAVNCHHNYVAKENHFGKNVWVTRKGAVRARKGDLGIIPGSMGECSFIVRGKGNDDSFHSCSHGAGRIMSRTEAKKRFTLEDHERDTEGVECRKDSSVLDETPKAYKRIKDVMAAQSDLIEVVHELKQVLCVKG